MVAGAKGAVGSTLAAAVSALQSTPEMVLSSLTTRGKFPQLGNCAAIHMVGWDLNRASLLEVIEQYGIIPEKFWRPEAERMERISLRDGVPERDRFQRQVEVIKGDIEDYKSRYPGSRAVLVNLLPASSGRNLNACASVAALNEEAGTGVIPDLAYVVAAVESKVPVVNFSPNEVEIPAVLRAAVEHGVPVAGRDGKTGQTYFKVVLASALKARSLLVDGWYSLNILGNADGKNLMNPEKAEAKIANKTTVLEGILGYRVGEQYDSAAHKVHIDYYPPRGDAKEAWDVIDFLGLFGLPMSLRLNLLGRDSILAVPLILDLARWVAALQLAGRSGPIPELGFFFKRPIGDNPPLSFQDQIAGILKLEKECTSMM